MTSPSLVDRLLTAVTTEKQDALADGTDRSPRVRQRLDAMVDAIGVVELAERQASRLAASQATARPSPSRFRDWMTVWTYGARR